MQWLEKTIDLANKKDIRQMALDDPDLDKSEQRRDSQVESSAFDVEARRMKAKKESRTLLRLPMRTEHTLNLLRHQRGAADIRLTTHTEHCISASTTM
jgi:hypothetical protein